MYSWFKTTTSQIDVAPGLEENKNELVSTNIGKQFLQLIEKHFPTDHKLRKCINRNCIKLSYSCTKNMKNIILTHNKKVSTKQNNPAETQTSTCNCRNKQNCPLDGKCKTGAIVYRASVKDARGNTHTYIGSTKEFKDRYRNHTKSFRHKQYSKETTLAGFVWENNLGPEPNIKWEIVKRAQPYRKSSRYCDLCLTEKLSIDYELKKSRNCLNKRSDLTNRCVHRTMFRLIMA